MQARYLVLDASKATPGSKRSAAIGVSERCFTDTAAYAAAIARADRKLCGSSAGLASYRDTAFATTTANELRSLRESSKRA